MMATGGKDDTATAGQSEASAPKHPEIFYNPAGRYQPLTGKSSAFDLLDLSELFSDTS